MIGDDHTKEARDTQILEILTRRGFAAAEEIAAELNISAVTVRRDFVRLEKENLITRVHGGVTPGREGQFGLHLNRRSQINPERKRAIAGQAASLVRKGETLFLDAGSTCCRLAEALPSDFNLTVITHSLAACLILKNRRGFHVICPGGELSDELGAFIGPLTEEALKRMSADRAFLGAAALNLEKGCVNSTIVEWKIKTLFHRQAKAPVILADSMKFDLPGFYQIIPIEEMKTVVTDDGLSAERAAEYESRSIRIIRAQVQPDRRRGGAST